ncbi:hypothetical protein OUZ56_017621 [Daphnia magna]|uniref:Uncharacterized protein n=1 Tax=Daphnia magna TaxID=35525 RepID=A0ABR0ATE2_9CRUS|nr:hypothetical protein OUZ56_017621 [Daphnia magna]
MRDYDVTLLFAFAILMATSAGTDGFVLIWTLDYTTPTPYYTTSYAAPSYSTKALEYYTTYAAPSYYTESPNYLVYYTTRTPKYYTTIYSAPTYYTQAIKYYAAQRPNAGKLMKTKPKSCLEFFEIHLNLTPEKDLPLIRNRTGDIHSKINCELLLLKMEKLCNVQKCANGIRWPSMVMDVVGPLEIV